MAAISLTGLLTAPIYGLIQDWSRRTRVLILFAILWPIGGNFLYFYGGSKYVLLASRAISGVGAGAYGNIFADISRSTTEKERTAVMSGTGLLRQVGVLIGPAVIIQLNNCDFYIGPFHVDKISGPGLVLFILFIILVTFLCYYDIPRLQQQMEARNRDRKPDPVKDDGGTRLDGTDVKSLDRSSPSERTGARDASESAEAVRISGCQDTTRFPRLSALLREEVVVLLTAAFVFFFNQYCLETGMTVMTRQLMHFTGVENSLVYTSSAIVALTICGGLQSWSPS